MEHLVVLLVSIPVYLGGIAAEAASLPRRRRAGADVVGYERRDTVASLAMGAGSLVVGVPYAAAAAVLADLCFRARLVDLPNAGVAWLVAMVGWDLLYYWTHRWEHEVRFFWAGHVNHHSSERYNLSTALRQPWTPFLTVVTFPLLGLVGVEPWLIFVAGGLNLAYQYWIHTEAIDRMPAWFEAVFNTPSHHRVHHGSNRRYLDRNHGGVLIVWDRLFGTFQREEERVVYGLTTDIGSFDLRVIAFHEYAAIARDVRAARTWRARLGHVVGRPGWRPAPSPVAVPGTASRLAVAPEETTQAA
ncbi:MAG: sterol desaturase family protein [Acidimicrobiales bacterium]|nr:sterol desaturase family protein [Acidimicrobiales bacterium]